MNSCTATIALHNELDVALQIYLYIGHINAVSTVCIIYKALADIIALPFPCHQNPQITLLTILE